MRGHRKKIAVCCGVLSLLLSVATPKIDAQDHPYEGVTLRVGVWGGDWLEQTRDLIGKPFEEATGATIEYVAGNPQNHAARIFAARGAAVPFDVVQMDDLTAAQLARARVLEPLRYDQIPNADDIFDFMKTEYYVAFLAMVNGFCYNVDALAAMGISPPQTMQDLFNPALAGRVTVPTLVVAMGPFPPLLLAHENGGDIQHVEPGFKKLAELEVFYYYTSSADLASKLTSGDVVVAFWQSSRCARLAATGFPVGFEPVRIDNPVVSNKVGIPTVDYYGIVAGTKQSDAAHAFINHALSVQSQLEFSRWSTTSPSSRSAIAAVLEDPEMRELVPWTVDDFENMYVPEFSVIEANFRHWNDLWNRYLR